jgi:hypothetical protein
MSRIFYLFVLLLITNGCTVYRVTALKSDIDECKQRLTSSEEYKYLNANHFMPWKDDYIDTHPSAVDLMDKAIATNDEVVKFMKVHSMLQGCRKTTIEHVTDIMPTVIPKAINGFMSADEVLAQLFEKKITWGQFAYQFKTVLSNTANDVNNEVLKSEMERQGKIREFMNNINNVSLGFALTILQAWTESQAHLYSAPIYSTYSIKPTIIDCTVNRFGSSNANVSCFSF